MKKVIIVLLILGAAVGAFAQNQETDTGALAQGQAANKVSPLSFSLMSDFRASAMQYSTSSNTRDRYTGTSIFNILTFPGDYDRWGPLENEFKLSIDYNKKLLEEKNIFIKGHLRMNMDALIKGAGGFVANDGKQNNNLVNYLLNQPFDEWNVQGSLGSFNAFVGNTSNRGLIKVWNGVETLKFKQEQFGVVTPGIFTADGGGPEIPWDLTKGGIPYPYPYGNWQESGKLPPENTNFGKALNVAGNYDQQDIPYFAVTAKFLEKFTVAVAGDLTPRSDTSGSYSTRLNGGVRFSGEKIFDLLTFDLTYKFRGGDSSTKINVDQWDPADKIEPDGSGRTTNSFTLGGQLDLLENTLGVQLAYTGVFRAYEDEQVKGTDVIVTQTGPFFSGIDLRFQYTGLDKFKFNMDNHVTFSSVGETKYTDGGVDPVVMYDFWGKKISSAGADTNYDWLAMYNALGVQYFLTEKLKLWLEVGNKLSSLTTTIGEAVRNDTYDILGASLKAVFTINQNLLVEAGLAFYYATYNWTINDAKYDSIEENRQDGGTTRLTTITTNNTVFQIPLRLRILFD